MGIIAKWQKPHKATKGPQPQFGRESRIGRIPKEGRPKG